MNKYKQNNIYLLLGPISFVLCSLFLPEQFFPTEASRSAIGTFVWMSIWWVSSCIDYAVTSFLPIIVNVFFNIAPMSSVISNYSSETILLLLGASILTSSWDEVGLDKRIAYRFLSLIGTSATSQIYFWFLLSVAMSTIIPNTIVVTTITPIAVSMLKFVGIDNIEKSELGSLILMLIAWGAGLGGLASPLGGAMNLVIVEYIESYTQTEFFYLDWVVKFAPIMLVLLVTNLIFVYTIQPKDQKIEKTKDYFIHKYEELGRISAVERNLLILFLIAITLSFSRSLYVSVFPGLTPAYVFITASFLTFLMKDSRGIPLVTWKNTEKKVIWGLLYVFAGGLAVGTLLTSSGASKDLGNMLVASNISSTLSLVFIIIFVTIVLSDLTSNTAAAAISLPIIMNLTTSSGLNPMPYIFAASIGVNVAYCLPTSHRAIPVGYGLPPKYMFKHGINITLILIVTMTITVYSLIEYWPYFSEG